jgi:hypothetical protein
MSISTQQLIAMLEKKISKDILNEVADMLQMSPFLGYNKIKELISEGKLNLNPDEEELLKQYWWSIY